MHLLLYIPFLEVDVEVNFPISSENKDMIESLKQDDNIVKAMRTSKVCLPIVTLLYTCYLFTHYYPYQQVKS